MANIKIRTYKEIMDDMVNMAINFPFSGLPVQPPGGGGAVRKTYTYPDGTQSVNRPSDGQVFYVWDKNGNPDSTWQWDDYTEQWHNISSGKPTAQNTKTFAVPSAEVQGEWAKAVVTKMPVCECGARHTEFPNIHLRFCPLYTP